MLTVASESRAGNRDGPGEEAAVLAGRLLNIGTVEGPGDDVVDELDVIFMINVWIINIFNRLMLGLYYLFTILVLGYLKVHKRRL